MILARISAPVTDWTVLRNCLVGHLVDTSGEIRDQCWGQLMGSFLSFPILCIVNAAMTWSAMEEVGIRWSLWADCVRVNGDDILFPFSSERQHYRIWSHRARDAGLSPSPGKNFRSRDFCTINSVLFCRERLIRYEGDFPLMVSYWRKYPTINLGLLYSPTCSMKDLFQVRGGWSKSLRTRAEGLVDGFDVSSQKRLIKAFIRFHRPILDQLPPLSWWVAEDLGGLGIPTGIPTWEPWDKEIIKSHHLRLAAFLHCLTPSAYRSSRRLEKIRSARPSMGPMGEVDNLNRRVGLPLSYIPRGQDLSWAHEMDLEFAYSRLGVDLETTDERQFLRAWNRWYDRVVNESKKTRGVLHAMNGRKACEVPARIVGYDLSLVTQDRDLGLILGSPSVRLLFSEIREMSKPAVSEVLQ